MLSFSYFSYSPLPCEFTNPCVSMYSLSSVSHFISLLSSYSVSPPPLPVLFVQPSTLTLFPKTSSCTCLYFYPPPSPHVQVPSSSVHFLFSHQLINNSNLATPYFSLFCLCHFSFFSLYFFFSFLCSLKSTPAFRPNHPSLLLSLYFYLSQSPTSHHPIPFHG